MNCKNCGNSNEPGDLYCAYCGAQLKPSSIGLKETAKANNAKKRTRWIVFVCILLCVVALLLFFLLRSSWEKTLSGYINSRNGDPVSFVDYLSPSYTDYLLEHYEIGSISEMKQRLRKMYSDDDDNKADRFSGYEIVESKELSDEEIQDRFRDSFGFREGLSNVEACVHVTVKLTYTLSEPFLAEIDVIKVNGRWYIGPYGSGHPAVFIEFALDHTR